MYVFYDIDGKTILASSAQPFEGAVEVDFTVVRAFDGRLYAEDEAPVMTPEQVREEAAAQRRTEIIVALDALDAKGVRAARAVALAVANGEQVNAADVEKLASIEEAAQALRAEMGAL